MSANGDGICGLIEEEGCIEFAEGLHSLLATTT
jgi:hypothetical protein